MAILYIRHKFATGSRDLRRLDAVTRSPCYSHLASTVKGLSIIRSYQAEPISLREFYSKIDDNSRTQFMFHTSIRWAAIRLDWLTFLFITALTYLAIVTRVLNQTYTTSTIAVTLSWALTLTGVIQWVIR